jgi:hypothetical protein
MKRILINVLYINKEEFYASSWKSTKVILRSTVNQSSRVDGVLCLLEYNSFLIVYTDVSGEHVVSIFRLVKEAVNWQ